MAAPSLTYTLTNGSIADASQVMQDFNDLLNGITDGTKDLSINALTCAGTATLNGDTNIGNASADTLTITASLGSTIPVKTDVTYNIGTSSLRLNQVYAQEYYGIQANTAATTGCIGQVLGPITRARASATSLTSAVAVNVCTVTKITLTAGDWSVTGQCDFQTGGGTTISELSLAISKTSATMPSANVIGLPTSGECWQTHGFAALVDGGADYTMAIPPYQVTVANGATLDLYLVARASFGVNTCSVYGAMEARRMR